MNKLNLKGVKCPLNFVKAKLALEKLEKGEILQINLDCREAMDSVSKSLLEEGHEILNSNYSPDDCHLLIKNRGSS